MSSTARAAASQHSGPAAQLSNTTNSTEAQYSFEVPAEFAVFGRWLGPAVHIAGEGTEESLANWMALNESATSSEQELWQRCIESNSGAFTTLRTMELFDSSLDLPKGNVVFSSVENPGWIKDDPPGPILDRLAAVRCRFPSATIWLHEPVYQRPATEDAAPVLLTDEKLNDEASHARASVWTTYQQARSRYRMQFHFRRVYECLRARWRNYQRHEAISQKALELRTATYRDKQRYDVVDYISEAKSLGLHKEADYMRMAAYGPEGMSARAIARAEAFEKSVSGSIWSELERIAHVIGTSQFSVVALAALSITALPLALVTISAALIPSVVLIDPILTFTTSEYEDRHWFIGHWDWKPSHDGAKTLVYI